MAASFGVKSIESRILTTWLSKKPFSNSFSVAMGTVLLIILITQIYWYDVFGLAQYLPAINENVYSKGEVWRLLTAIFIHADFKHLLSNLFLVSVFSYFIYGYYGSRVYIGYCWGGAVLANVMAVWTYPPEVRLVGASGLAYLLTAFWLTLFIFIQRQYKIANRLLRMLGVGLLLLFPTTFSPQTSYRTHGFAFGIGVVLAMIYFFRNKSKFRAEETYKIDKIEMGEYETADEPIDAPEDKPKPIIWN